MFTVMTDNLFCSFTLKGAYLVRDKLLLNGIGINSYIFDIPLMKMLSSKLIVVKPASSKEKPLLFLNS